MNNIRIRFVRGEEVKYISHLDLIKVFERAGRRASLPIEYSKGFNPHPQMVFGLPLSVGVTSEAEYAEFDLAEPMNPGEFGQRLNEKLPAGFKVVDAKEKKVKSNIMATISKAAYEVLVSSRENMGINEICEKIAYFMNKPSIIVKKEGKSGVKDIDIKPMIFKLEAKFLKGSEPGEQRNAEGNERSQNYCSNGWLVRYVDELKNSDIKHSFKVDNIFCLSMLVSAGSAANLKPELLVSALNESTDLDMKLVKIHRTGLYTNREGNLTDPLDDSVLLGL